MTLTGTTEPADGSILGGTNRHGAPVVPHIRPADNHKNPKLAGHGALRWRSHESNRYFAGRHSRPANHLV
jgi:hypothetical protein